MNKKYFSPNDHFLFVGKKILSGLFVRFLSFSEVKTVTLFI